MVEAIHGNIKAFLRRGRGYRDLAYRLLKAQRLAVTKIEFVAFREPPRMHFLTDCCAEPEKPCKERLGIVNGQLKDRRLSKVLNLGPTRLSLQFTIIHWGTLPLS